MCRYTIWDLCKPPPVLGRIFFLLLLIDFFWGSSWNYFSKFICKHLYAFNFCFRSTTAINTSFIPSWNGNCNTQVKVPSVNLVPMASGQAWWHTQASPAHVLQQNRSKQQFPSGKRTSPCQQQHYPPENQTFITKSNTTLKATWKNYQWEQVLLNCETKHN